MFSSCFYLVSAFCYWRLLLCLFSVVEEGEGAPLTCADVLRRPPEVLLSPQPQARTRIIIDSAGSCHRTRGKTFQFSCQRSLNFFSITEPLTDLTMDLWLARWHVDMISRPTTGNEIAGSVTNLAFVLQLLHLDVSRGQISNKGTAARAIAEPTTRQKRQSQKRQ